MPSILISDISVNFPFQPYDVQQKYMEKVIECLRKGVSGVLESPTGTGKTLCLLCATLAWLEVRKAQNQALAAHVKHENVSTEFEAKLCNKLTDGTGIAWGDVSRMVIPKIIYSSRTHSQLSQAINELKRSDYKHVKATVLGSRDQLCLHPEVMKESSSSIKIHMCRAKVNNRTCHFYNGVETAIANPLSRQNAVVDIEDLLKLGSKTSCCPYYLSRSLKQEADIIFMPYNYLLDPKSRKAHGIELAGNVVIFDEAHNVEKMCEESVSFELTSQDVATCISEVTQVMRQLAYIEKSKGDDLDLTAMDSGSNLDFTLSDLCILKTLFCELEEQLDNIPLQNETNSATFPGSYIFEFLAKVELTPDRKTVILELLEKLIHHLTAGSMNPTMRRGGGLQKFADMIKVIFNQDKSNQLYFNKSTLSYKVHVCVMESNRKGQRNDIWTAVKSTKKTRSLNYWCFNPGIGMQNLLEDSPRCILLTSGTLSPLNNFASELQISLPVRLENPHIIKKNQLWVGVVSNGPDGTPLNSSFQNRCNEQYIASLGNAIVNFARVIPKGLLVFFPSYSVMNECQKVWEKNSIWQSIGNYKTIFMENQIRMEFQQVIEEFYKQNDGVNGKGGVFMAVCRGKVSEGLDFADNNGRGVVITGLPFPPWKDPKVNLKMAYLNEQVKLTKSSTNGQEWYRMEASRAVNQAIGRVIRHKDDFGAIILCDNRFNDKNFQSQLSAWLKPHVQAYSNFGLSLKSLIQFFKHITIENNRDSRIHISKSNLPVEIHKSNTFDNESLPSSSSRSTKSKIELEDSVNESSQLEDYLKNQKLSYSSEIMKSNQRQKSTSLFDAIDDHENEAVEHSNISSQKCQSVKSENFEEAPAAPKKRKFNVIGPKQQYEMKQWECASAISSQSGASSSKESFLSSLPVAESDATSFMSNSALNVNCKNKSDVCSFMVDVKKYISPESYQQFKVAIRNYSRDHNLDGLIGCFSALCKHPEILKRLCVFRNFVPKHQRDQYDEEIKKLLEVKV